MVRSASRSSFLFGHDLFGGPDSTFLDHALASARPKGFLAESSTSFGAIRFASSDQAFASERGPERTDCKRIGPRGRRKNESESSSKRERIFDSLTNHFNADLSAVSSEKSAPLFADLAFDAQGPPVTKISSATALRFERSIRSRRQTKEAGARRAILGRMQASGG